MKRIWILGAADPEMVAIRGLCEAAGLECIQAMKDGKPVHGGNAYAADMPLPVEGHEYILVECSAPPSHPLGQPAGNYPVYYGDGGPAYSYCPEGGEYAGDYKITRVDHHRPGDPGYGKPPEEFMSASSLGQVIALLHGQPGAIWTFGGLPEDFETIGWGLWSQGHAVDLLYRPTPEQVLAAAADHCLEAAYRGRCPGVDPDELMRWRAESRAAFQKRPVGAVLADIEAARKILREWVELHDQPFYAPSDGYDGDHYAGDIIGRLPAEYADLRGQEVPELPEAACREGIAYLASVTEPSGRRKVTLGAAPPELVQRFLAGNLCPELVDRYGDPARGFAGGYLPPEGS